jgi:hypothetical protein
MCRLPAGSPANQSRESGKQVSRPTVGALTGLGYSQQGTSTKYVKSNTTAVAACDIGSGAVGIAPLTPGVPMAQADYQSHVADLAKLGVLDPAGHNVPQTVAGGLQSYSVST